MGFGGIGIWQLLIVLVIVLLLFGTKRLKNIGADLGGAIKGFKGAVKDGKKAADDSALIEKADEEGVIEGEVTKRESASNEKKD